MGSYKTIKPVDLANLPVIRRNPDRHAKRIGYQKTKKEITSLSAKKSKSKTETVKKSSPKLQPVLKSSPKIEPLEKSPSKRPLPNCEKTQRGAPEAPRMPYVERKFFAQFF